MPLPVCPPHSLESVSARCAHKLLREVQESPRTHRTKVTPPAKEPGSKLPMDWCGARPIAWRRARRLAEAHFAPAHKPSLGWRDRREPLRRPRAQPPHWQAASFPSRCARPAYWAAPRPSAGIRSDLPAKPDRLAGHFERNTTRLSWRIYFKVSTHFAARSPAQQPLVF